MKVKNTFKLGELLNGRWGVDGIPVDVVIKELRRLCKNQKLSECYLDTDFEVWWKSFYTEEELEALKEKAKKLQEEQEHALYLRLKEKYENKD